MKEERKINIEVNNSIVAQEYVAYLERKDARKREARRRFWSNFQIAVCNMLLGAEISVVVILAIIGLNVVL